MNRYHLRTIITVWAISLTISFVSPTFADDSDGNTGGWHDGHTNASSDDWGGGSGVQFSSGLPSAPPNCYWVHIGGQNNERDELVCSPPPPPQLPPLPTVTNYDPWTNPAGHERVTRTVLSTHATVVDGAAQADLNPPGLYCGQDLTDVTELAAGRPVIHKCHN